MTKPTVSRSIVAPADASASRSAAIPGRGVVRSRSRPSRAIGSVLAHHRRDVRDRADRREVRQLERLGLGAASSPSRRRATVNATPAPDRPRSG